MTFEEAKKILEKEGFYVEKATRPCAISEAFTEYEDPSICKAMQVVSSAGYFVCMEKSCFDERKARLKKEHEKHANAPSSGKEKAKKGNPALKEAASQFNDALLDEQGKKIKHLTKKISRLNKIIHKKNEELRLTKIREKNLAELGLKYVGENEKLKKELADKVVDKIDAQALKSAESALAYKEKVIAEKDEVIADLGNELAEAKKLNTAKILDINAKCMRAARESINDVFESYAAKYAKSTLDELKDKAYETFNAKAHKLGLVGSKDGNGIIDQIIRVDIAEEGGDHSDVIVLCGTDFVKMLTENEDFIHDLFGKKHKEIKEFMSAEAEQLFEGDGIPTKMEVMKPSRKFKKIK